MNWKRVVLAAVGAAAVVAVVLVVLSRGGVRVDGEAAGEAEQQVERQLEPVFRTAPLMPQNIKWKTTLNMATFAEDIQTIRRWVFAGRSSDDNSVGDRRPSEPWMLEVKCSASAAPAKTLMLYVNPFYCHSTMRCVQGSLESLAVVGVHKAAASSGYFIARTAAQASSLGPFWNLPPVKDLLPWDQVAIVPEFAPAAASAGAVGPNGVSPDQVNFANNFLQTTCQQDVDAITNFAASRSGNTMTGPTLQAWRRMMFATVQSIKSDEFAFPINQVLTGAKTSHAFQASMNNWVWQVKTLGDKNLSPKDRPCGILDPAASEARINKYRTGTSMDLCTTKP